MTDLQQPIGIFDSGVGGLTVAHAISKALPGEKLLYFGDTAHFPYGEKSDVAIRGYCAGIAKFLVENGAKAIVIACNTGSSFGVETVKDVVNDAIPVIDVIEPVVNYTVARYTGKRVGVIGTRGTVGSNIYQRKINKQEASIIVRSLATPLLAPLVEEGLFSEPVSKSVVNHYLSQPALQNIDALILACTHYPLLMEAVMEYYGDRVEIIDSAAIVAEHTARELTAHHLLNAGKNLAPEHQFFVSDLTPSFLRTAEIFFRQKVALSHLDLW